MGNQVKNKIKEVKDNINKDPREVYFRFFNLVEQAINARIIADLFWKYHTELIYHSGEIKNITNYSRVALENFAVLEIWKLFDKKNSVFHIWDVAKYLNDSNLNNWLESNYKRI